MLRQPVLVESDLPLLLSTPPEACTLLPHDTVPASQLMQRRHHLATRLEQLRKAGLSAQISYAIWRAATGADCTYRAATTGIPGPTTEQLDAHQAVVRCQHIGVPALQTPLARVRIFQPLRDGGMGLTAQTYTAPAAYAASWHQCLPSVLSLLHQPDLHHIVHHCPRLCAHLQALDDHFRRPLLGHPATRVDADDVSMTLRDLTREHRLELQAQAESEAAPPERAAQLSAGGPRGVRISEPSSQ